MQRPVSTLPTLILCAVVLLAQVVAAFHAFEHNLDAQDSQVCAACTTVAQLGTASVDTQEPAPLEAAGVVPHRACAPAVPSTLHAVVRQRGPPAAA